MEHSPELSQDRANFAKCSTAMFFCGKCDALFPYLSVLEDCTDYWGIRVPIF